MKVSKEQAQQEVDSWLDFKKISEKKRETYQDQIDTLVSAISDGYLVLGDNKVFTQTLRFPVEGDLGFETLDYKPRVSAGAVQANLQRVKLTDSQGMMMAYACALTDKPSALMKKMDQAEDWSLLQAIVIFFM